MADAARPSTPPPRIPEAELIPYEASTFESRAALVLAPHPDDEVFGCGAAVASLRRSGAAVTVWVASDGAGDERDPEARRRTEALRLAESAAALDLLGGAELLAGGFPDRGLLDRVEAVADALAALLSKKRPDLVLAPSPAEVHPDHRGVTKALVAVARRGAGDPGSCALSAARVAFYEVSQPIRPNFLLDATPHVPAKDRAMAAFPSQTGGRDYPAFVRGLNAYRRMTLPREVEAAEGYFVLPGGALREVSDSTLLGWLGPVPRPAALPSHTRADAGGGILARLLARLAGGRRAP